MHFPTPRLSSVLTLCVCLTTNAFAQEKPAPLKDSFVGKFLIGAALSSATLQGRDVRSEELATRHFSAFTGENSMKPDSVQPSEGRFTFIEADAMVDLAQKSGATPIGHTLIWHSQTPKWFTHDGAGRPLRRMIALQHLRDHIATVVGRYKGRVKQWDVVNEVISDRNDEFLRPTPWLAAIGPDYIAEAFRAAHRADPKAILILNDYNNEVGGKRERTLRLLKQLLAEGVPVHAVGIQAHWRLGHVPLEETEKAIAQYSALGLKVMITELDIGVLPTNYTGADIGMVETARTPSPTTLSAEDAQKLADAYARSFALFLRHKDVIGRVTLWGLHDGDSWLNDFPVRGRTDHPLLFDRAGQPKAAFFSVQRAAQEAP
jgi:endo-1,4-beta-xylanase